MRLRRRRDRDGVVVLVDTSVWIEVFRSRSRVDIESVVPFDDMVTCLPVVQEVLQGFRDERAHRVASQALLAFPILESPLGVEVHLGAAELYRAARRAGITPRSGVDCLIAECAIRNAAVVLHADRDFDQLARVSRLQARSLSALR